MVYGQIARIAAEGARAAGVYIIPRAIKTFTKYDKKIFRNLYGKSGGRGVRHGRDIGAAVGGLMAFQTGDDLDGFPKGPGYTPSKRRETYSGYGNRGGYGRGKYGSRNCVCGRPRKFKSNPGSYRKYR